MAKKLKRGTPNTFDCFNCGNVSEGKVCKEIACLGTPVRGYYADEHGTTCKPSLIDQLKYKAKLKEEAEVSCTRLEKDLLRHWHEHGVKYVFKYKYRILEYRGEDSRGIELFYDLSYKAFSDMEDVATVEDLPSELKVSVEELMKRRGIA